RAGRAAGAGRTARHLPRPERGVPRLVRAIPSLAHEPRSRLPRRPRQVPGLRVCAERSAGGSEAAPGGDGPRVPVPLRLRSAPRPRPTRRPQVAGRPGAGGGRAARRGRLAPERRPARCPVMTRAAVAAPPPAAVLEHVACYGCGGDACTDFLTAQDDLTGKP